MVATRGGIVDSALMLDEDAKEHIREGMELKERFGKWVVNGGGYANNVRSEGKGGGYSVMTMWGGILTRMMIGGGRL